MYEMRFLEQALEELQSLREENEKLKRQICVYEEFMNDIREILKGRHWKLVDGKRVWY